MEPVTSARGLTGTDSRAGGEAAENRTDLLKHGRHQLSETGARSADRVHNPGPTEPISHPATHPDSRPPSADLAAFRGSVPSGCQKLRVNRARPVFHIDR